MQSRSHLRGFAGQMQTLCLGSAPPSAWMGASVPGGPTRVSARGPPSHPRVGELKPAAHSRHPLGNPVIIQDPGSARFAKTPRRMS